MGVESTPCNIEDVSQAFVESPKYIYQTIANKMRTPKTLFSSLIERGTYEWGRGYIQYKEEFHGGLPIQDGAASWSVMAKYRKPGTNGQADPGYDPCKSSALTVSVGTEEKQFTIYQTERRSEDICLTDALVFWQLEQQLSLWYKALANVSTGEWEQVLGRAYEKFCSKFIARAATSSTVTGLDTFTLTPAAGAVFGGSIAIPAGGLGTIGVLNQSILDRIYSYLVRQVEADGWLGQEDGMPLFGIAASQETIGDLIKEDSATVQALYYAKPAINIEGYGKMRTFKNFVQMNDWNTVRYKPSSDGLTLEAVYPYETVPTTINEAIAVNPDYINAPFEVVRIIIRNVYKALVPPPNPSAISGFKFSPYDNIMDWTFENIKERCENPRQEKGYFLSRGRMAPEPGVNSAYACEVLVRRCVDLTIKECTACTNEDLTPTMISVAQLDTTETPALSKNWIIVLDACLDCNVGDRVTVIVTGTGSGTKYGTLVDNLAGASSIVVHLDTAIDLSLATMGTVACGGNDRA